MKNKRNKIAGFLKFEVFLLCISFLLWNCEKDPVIEHTHETINNTSKYSRTLINDLIEKDKTFSKLSENYLIDKLHKKKSSLKNTSNNLIITSDTVSVVEKENYKSYTIRIKRSGQEYDTENLVIEEKDGIKNTYILSYDFDNQWIENRIKGIHTPPKGKIYYSKYDISNLTSKTTALNKAGGCSYVTITIISPCPCEGHITSCGCYKQPTSYTTSQLVCDSGGGSENDFGSPLPTTGNGPLTGGGGGPSPSSNNSQTQANLESMAEFIEFKLNKLVTELKLNDNQAKWVSKHTKEALDIYDFVAKENSWKNEAKNFANSAIEILSLKELSSTVNINTFKNRILKITTNLKTWGNPEDRIFAQYIESLVQDFNKMTVGDVYDIYKLTKKQSHILIWKYATAVVRPVAEAAYPFVVYALTEATLGAALPLISRIPLASVIRGAKLNNMVKNAAKLGVKSKKQANIRIISNTTPQQARALFDKLSPNYVKRTVLKPGVIQADMGSGNFLLYRSVSKSGFEATINMNFKGIWNAQRVLKFIK